MKKEKIFFPYNTCLICCYVKWNKKRGKGVFKGVETKDLFSIATYNQKEPNGVMVIISSLFLH